MKNHLPVIGNSAAAVRTFLFSSALMLSCFFSFAQPGKDGPLTITAANQVVNKYTTPALSISVGDNMIAAANASVLALCPGDLIMVYQAQGASIDTTNSASYGNVLAYNSAGLYEFKYVQSVSGNFITVQTTFTNSYSTSGKTQIIKVPQYTTLTINSGASLAAKAWKDTVINSVNCRIGGIVVVHAESILNTGTITASGSGFRGGAVQSAAVPYQFFATSMTSTASIKGAQKGEGILGYVTDYDSNGGRYCKGAPANGGGGGTSTNAGGGGGANGNNGNTWTGHGNMIVDANNPLAAWSLDPGYIANGNSLTTSGGGGRGGYSVSGAPGNPQTLAPGSSSWGSDYRREMGGRGGRPLTNINAETRIYFGGGGGAGDANNQAGTSGGNGGGIVYLIATTGITGNGTIESNGNSVGNTPGGCNCDGSGAGGAGGSIVIKTGAISSSLTINVRGGDGGSQLPIASPGGAAECEGPGGGGGGGFVAITTGTITPNISGGSNGTTQAVVMTQMTSNGVTQGAAGQTGTVSASFVSILPGTSCVTSIKENNIISASNIFPNPNNGTFYLNIENEPENAEIVLYNSIGQQVHVQKVMTGKNTVITNGLPKGLYQYALFRNKRQIGTGKISLE